MREIELEIIGLVLFFIVIIGVVIMIVGFLKKLAEKNYTQNKVDKIKKQLIEFETLSTSKLKTYESVIKQMSIDIAKYKEKTDEIILSNTKCVDEIMIISQKIIDMNSVFYLKVELLEKVLSQDYTSDEQNQLATIISDDITFLRDLQLEMESYHKQRNLALQNDIKARNKAHIDREYELDE